MRTRTVPRGARQLRAYAELESYLADFVRTTYQFLIIIGRPGLAKTESIKRAIRGRQVLYYKGGQLTPAQFYIDCYHHRGEPVILDDAEHLLDNKVGAKLVSALGDTTPVKTLAYATTGRVLGDVPQNYNTTSPLCIIGNRIALPDEIQSRAVILDFSPSNEEIHRAASAWFWDQTIHDWFGAHLHRLTALDARWYLIAHQDKQSGRDWRQILLRAHAPNRVTCIVQDLESDPAYPTREAKAQRFVELAGASRVTYFRLRRRLEEEQRLIPAVVSPIPLRRTKAPGKPSLLELESMEVPPADLQEDANPLDVPVREQFAEPIRTSTASITPSGPRPFADDADTLAWEKTSHDDDGDEE